MPISRQLTQRKAIRQVNGTQIIYEKLRGGKRGFSDFKNEIIYIDSGLEGIEKDCALIHEKAHFDFNTYYHFAGSNNKKKIKEYSEKVLRATPFSNELMKLRKNITNSKKRDNYIREYYAYSKELEFKVLFTGVIKEDVLNYSSILALRNLDVLKEMRKSKKRKKIKFQVENWHNFDLESQEKICQKYDVVLLKWLPFKRMKVRKFYNKMQKTQDAIFSKVDSVVEGVNQFTENIDVMFKEFDKQFQKTASSPAGRKTLMIGDANNIKIWAEPTRKKTRKGKKSRNSNNDEDDDDDGFIDFFPGSKKKSKKSNKVNLFSGKGIGL